MDYIPQFGDNTQDVSGLPQDDSMMQLALKRKLALADALRQQESPQGQMVSGHYVAPSWTQYAANALGKYAGGKQEENALKQYGEYQKAKQAKLADLLAGKEVQAPVDYNEAGNMPGMTQTTRQPYNQQEFMSKAVQTMPDLAPELVKNQLAAYTKDNTPINVAQGGTVIDRTGKVLYQSPAKEDKTTYSTLGKLTSELQQIQSANPNDPRIPQYQDAIKKETTASQGAESNIGKLTSEMNSFPPNDPRRKIYEAAIRKETTVPSDYSQQNFAYNKARGLREDFSQLPEVKAWNVIQPTLVAARQAAKDTTGGSDLNLIYAMGKTMDPNSVVREGELQMAGDTGSYGQKIMGLYKSVANGGKLSPAVKADLLNQIESRATAQQNLYNNTKSKYTDIAKRNGVNPEDLFVEGITTPTNKSVDFNSLH